MVACCIESIHPLALVLTYVCNRESIQNTGYSMDNVVYVKLNKPLAEGEYFIPDKALHQGNYEYFVIEGRHRTLACQQLGAPYDKYKAVVLRHDTPADIAWTIGASQNAIKETKVDQTFMDLLQIVRDFHHQATKMTTRFGKALNSAEIYEYFRAEHPASVCWNISSTTNYNHFATAARVPETVWKKMVKDSIEHEMPAFTIENLYMSCTLSSFKHNKQNSRKWTWNVPALVSFTYGIDTARNLTL